MNNQKSNFFNENSFTYNSNEALVQEIYEYVIGILNDLKSPEHSDMIMLGSSSRFQMEKDLAEMNLILKQDPDNEYAKMVISDYETMLSGLKERQSERAQAAVNRKAAFSTESAESIDEKRTRLTRQIAGIKQQLDWEKKEENRQSFRIQLEKAQRELASLPEDNSTDDQLPEL